jgi:hypothetical protein
MMSRENGLSDVVMQIVKLSTIPTLWSSTGPSIAGSGPGEGKKNFGPTSKGETAKNLHPKWERLNLSYRVTWVWSERVNLYNRHMILPRKTKTYATYLGPRPPSGQPGPGNSYRLPVQLSGTVRLYIKTQIHLDFTVLSYNHTTHVQIPTSLA